MHTEEHVSQDKKDTHKNSGNRFFFTHKKSLLTVISILAVIIIGIFAWNTFTHATRPPQGERIMHAREDMSGREENRPSMPVNGSAQSKRGGDSTSSTTPEIQIMPSE
ncbi:MAG: hypothetical protein HGB03_00850 [Candidatus Yonathbacteria bacterium]|nr:hypothetical protein [Candidatus Yonathbacteria bacterium]NTW47811.1 hypothetical protein [Candidatus Yonathbacteria bacterium]